MNKIEKNVLLDRYKDICYASIIMDFDKEEVLREYRFLLDNLNLKKERYKIENKLISEKNEYNFLQREAFEMIFDTFLKYNRYINYDLEEIEMHYDDLQFEMNQEEIKCHKARIQVIENYIA